MRKNLTPPTLPLRPGEDPTDALSRIYAMGRSYPHQPPHDAPRAKSQSPQDGSPAGWELAPKENSPAVQARESGHAPGYDNDAPTSWLRGYGKEQHPFFDSGPSGNRYRK